MEKPIHHNEQHIEGSGNNEREIKIENEPNAVEVFGFLGLLGAGIFAVKKVWQADVGGIQEKTKSVAGELVDQAINTAKKSLAQSFPVEKSPELSNESRKVLVDHYLNKWYKGTETQKPSKEVTVDDILLKNKIADLEGLSKGDHTAAEIEKVLGKDIVDIMDNRDSRFKSLADIDPIFAQKMEHFTSESHEDIVSYIRKLDTTSRGAVASAFLSVD